ncbi:MULTISPECIES: SHOCT domain-containing protein [unclassified Cryobacterium]|uniref:SHOCT domain-containing protein n=1 Tax=unclassified Cryobacterium TaxID=2649013 RepID=UPI0018C947D2|nr:SHOCT domain-containing protein [Cryobacterium sp. CAN_C3]
MSMNETPFFTFTSHIDGKNARISVFQDRVEWVRPRGVSGGKITAGLLTGGLSLFATGFANGKSGTEMIPVKSMSSVTTSRDGLLNTKVSVITSGNTVDFRVSHAEAAKVKIILTQLILGSHPSQQVQNSERVAALPAPAVPQDDVMAQLAKLGELKAAGVLTAEEFTQKKAELLGRL